MSLQFARYRTPWQIEAKKINNFVLNGKNVKRKTKLTM